MPCTAGSSRHKIGPMESIYYFAYGSNLHPHRLKQRIPSSTVIDQAHLNQHRLRYHKNGGDGSAKCNVVMTGDEADWVIGVVYEMLAVELPILDRIEGLGYGYDREVCEVKMGEDWTEAYIYIAQAEYIVEDARPYCWYREFVVEGARHHQFPEHYIETHLDVEFKHDEDVDRRQLNRDIISGIY